MGDFGGCCNASHGQGFLSAGGFNGEGEFILAEETTRRRVKKSNI